MIRARLRCQRGQAIIETALVLPLLLTLVFGIAETSLYMFDYVQAANCAREAARRAAVRADNADSPPYCVSAKLKPTVTPGYKNLPVQSPVTATVTSSHNWLVINHLIPGLGPSTPLTARVVMRMEGNRL